MIKGSFQLKSFIILSIIIFFIATVISCTNSENNTSGSINGNKDSIIEFVESYREYARDFDKKNYELYQEFEKLETIDEGIANIEKRIENGKNYLSRLNSLKVPKEMEKFYSLKIQEVTYGIDLFESSIQFYKTGSPDIEELNTRQQELSDLSQKSFSEISEVLESFNLQYLMN